ARWRSARASASPARRRSPSPWATSTAPSCAPSAKRSARATMAATSARSPRPAGEVLRTRRRCVSQAADAGVLDVQVVVDPVFGALASDAGLLDAAEGCNLGGDQPLVDADEAVFEGLRDAEGTAEVARVEIAGEAEFRVVGEPHGLRLVLEAE